MKTASENIELHYKKRTHFRDSYKQGFKISVTLDPKGNFLIVALQYFVVLLAGGLRFSVFWVAFEWWWWWQHWW